MHRTQLGTRQSLATVVGAEVWRLLGRTSLHVLLFITVVLGTSLVAGSLEVFKALSADSALETEAGSVTFAVGGFGLAGLLGLVAVHVVASERKDGTVLSMLRIVPNRGRALAARSLALAVIAFGASLVWAALGIGYLGARGGLSQTPVAVAANAAAVVVTVVLCVMMAVLITVALENGILTVITYGLLFLVLPMVFAPLGLFGRLGWSRVGEFLLQLTPGSLASTLMSPPAGQAAVLVTSLVGLIVWVAATGALGYLRFRRIA